jgi:hypothetical protein
VREVVEDHHVEDRHVEVSAEDHHVEDHVEVSGEVLHGEDLAGARVEDPVVDFESENKNFAWSSGE